MSCRSTTACGRCSRPPSASMACVAWSVWRKYPKMNHERSRSMMTLEQFAREVKLMRDAQKKCLVVDSLLLVEEAQRHERFVDSLIAEAPDHVLVKETLALRLLQRAEGGGAGAGSLYVNLRRREMALDILVR